MIAYNVLILIVYALPILMLLSLTFAFVLLKVWSASLYEGKETTRASFIYTTVGGFFACAFLIIVRDSYAGEGRFPSIPLVNIAIVTLITSFFVFFPMVVEIAAAIGKLTSQLNAKPIPKPVSKLSSKEQRSKALSTFWDEVKVHDSLRMEVMLAFQEYYDTYHEARTMEPSRFAAEVTRLFSVLPAIYEYDEENGVPAIEYLKQSYLQNNDDMRVIHSLGNLKEMAERVKMIPISASIPHELRVEHHLIVGTTGHGKSTTLLSMILKDLNEDCAIVVIDSQGNLIRKLATRVPLDRLVLIDPETCPPALNMFDQKGKGEAALSDALELYTYIFSSAGQALTGRQANTYRALCRLCMAIPGATLHTLLKLLGPNGARDYTDEISKLGPTTQSFFERYNEGGVYKATKEEIAPRMDTILSEGLFGSMVGASRLGIDVAKEINAGKVILINTNANKLKEASPILGRFFMGQVMQTVRKRKDGDKYKRVYLYCDEFADFADDSKILTDCFSQGRQYGLAMVVCFQYFARIPEQVRAAITACTNIKFAGGVSQDDISYMANQMDVKPSLIKAQPKGTFLAYFKDKGVIPWKAKFGYVDTVPQLHTLEDAIEQSRRLYGDKPKPKPFDDTEEFKEGW